MKIMSWPGWYYTGLVTIIALLLTRYNVAGIQCFSCTSDSRKCPSQASVDIRGLLPVSCTSGRCMTVVGLLDPAGAWRGCAENSDVMATHHSGCYHRDRRLICVCHTDGCNGYPIGFVPKDRERGPHHDHITDPRMHRDQRRNLLNMAARITRDPWWRKVVPEPIKPSMPDFKIADVVPTTQKNGSATPKPLAASTTKADFGVNLISEGKPESWVSSAGEVQETVYDENSGHIPSNRLHNLHNATMVQPTNVAATRIPPRSEEIDAVVPYSKSDKSADENLEAFFAGKGRAINQGKSVGDIHMRQKDRAENNNYFLENVDEYLKQLSTFEISAGNQVSPTETPLNNSAISHDMTKSLKQIISPLDSTASNTFRSTIAPNSKVTLNTDETILSSDKTLLIVKLLMQLLRSQSPVHAEPDTLWLLDQLESEQHYDRHKGAMRGTRNPEQEAINLIDSESGRRNGINGYIGSRYIQQRPSDKLIPEQSKKRAMGLPDNDGLRGQGKERTTYYGNDPSHMQAAISNRNHPRARDYNLGRNKDMRGIQGNGRFGDGRYGVPNRKVTSYIDRDGNYPIKGHRNRPLPRNRISKTKNKSIMQSLQKWRTSTESQPVLLRRKRPNRKSDHIEALKTDKTKKAHPKSRFGEIPKVKSNDGIIKSSSRFHPKSKKTAAVETYDPPWMRRSTFILDKGVAGWQGRRRPHRRFQYSAASVVTVSKLVVLCLIVCVYHNLD